MSKHIISIDNFKDPATYEYLIASSSGGKTRKKLFVVANVKTLKVSFRIFDGTTSITAYTLENAIKLYNELS